MMETINYYNFIRFNVYLVLLDVTMAVDGVKYYKLFIVMFRERFTRQMSPLVIHVVRLLMYLHTNQRLWGGWRDDMSNQFCVVKDIKQGVLISSPIYNVH